MSETRDHVSVHIDDILTKLPPSPTDPTIHRVDDESRHGNEKLYDPKTLSIGPYHRRDDRLKKTHHRHKLMYTRCLMKRRRESTVDKYVVAMRSLEPKARSCYSGPVDLTPDEFVEMLILDGLFVVELLRKYGFDELREKDDPIFQYEHVLAQLRRDLMLVENQLPFFVLRQLFDMTKGGNPDDDILYLVRLFVDDVSPWPEASGVVHTRTLAKNADHLLGLVHEIWCSPFAKMAADRPVKMKEENIVAIHSADELLETGIKFKKDSGSHCFDIDFDKGVLRVPGFSVSDETESVFRNLIAHEHFFIDNRPKYMTDYAFFLHCLIKKSSDVQILRRRGIVMNLLGDDESVCGMFNRLGRNIPVSPEFCYAEVYDKVNGHCGHRANRWMAILRRDYFSSPWSFIKFFAACLLLLFTFTQTVCGVVSLLKSM